MIAQTFKAEKTHLDQPIIVQTAQGIAALYFNVMSLAPLAMSENWSANARSNAMRLLKQLGAPK